MLTIVRLTLLELLRRRLVHAMLVLTVLALALTTWGFSQLSRFLRLLPGEGEFVDQVQVGLIASQLLIAVLFMFSFVIALSAVFVAAPAVAGDLESGIAHAILARPIGRGAYLVGRWLGLTIAVAGYTAAVAAAQLVAVAATAGYLPPGPVVAVGLICLQEVAVATLALVLGTRLPALTAGVTAGVLFGVAWVAGVVGGIGRAVEDSTLGSLGPVSAIALPTDALWRGAVYALEPPAIILGAAGAGPQIAAFPLLVTEPIPGSLAVWSVAWIGLVVGLGIVALERRDV